MLFRSTYRLRGVEVAKVTMNAVLFVDEVCAVFDVMSDFRPKELIVRMSKLDTRREVLFYEYTIVEEFPNHHILRIVADAKISFMLL